MKIPYFKIKLEKDSVEINGGKIKVTSKVLTWALAIIFIKITLVWAAANTIAIMKINKNLNHNQVTVTENVKSKGTDAVAQALNIVREQNINGLQKLR